MRTKETFIMRQVGDTWAVVPVGQAAQSFNGMLTLNESGALLWNTLKDGANREELVKALKKVYSVSEEIAFSDVDDFIAKLKKVDAIIE